MRKSKLARLLALFLAMAMLAAACASDDAEEPEAEGEETEEVTEEAEGETEEEAGPVTVSYGNAQEFSNYNNGLASSNSVKNTIILNEILPSPYAFAGPTGELALNTELMDAVNVLSEDPLQVEWVVNADAAWSDGAAVDLSLIHI